MNANYAQAFLECRGMHRISLSTWYHPRGVVTAVESNLDPSTGVMCTPMTWRRQSEEEGGCFEAQLHIPRNLEPAYFSFLISHQGGIHDASPQNACLHG
jgi:hypothetical protein